MPRQNAPSLPQGRRGRMRKAGRRTKPRPHKRKRMRGGISRSLPMVRPKGSPELQGLAGPAKAAGIAPRLESAGGRPGLRPSRDPNGVRRRGFGLGGLRESGKAFGSRLDPKGISRGLGLERFHGRRDGLRPASFERATGKASAWMRAWRRRGFGRSNPQGTPRRAARPAERPEGDRSGLHRPFRNPAGTERGFAASLRIL